MGARNNKRKGRRNSIKPDLGTTPPPERRDPSSSSSSTNKEAIDETSNHRKWNELPEPILISILTLLPSAADLSCAACVSHPWNSAAAVASNSKWAPQHPPLLLTPHLTSPSPESFNNAFKSRWAPSRRCHLISLEANSSSSKPHHRPALSFQTLANSFCVGRHFSTLILISRCFILVHDVLSGEQLRSPKIAGLMDMRIDFATLTSPLRSASPSLVLLVAHETLTFEYYVFSWEPNGTGNRDGKFAIDTEIVSFALYKDRVYCLDRMKRVGVLDFEPEMSWKLLVDKVEELPISDWGGNPRPNLVECDGELLMVLFVQDLNPPYAGIKIEVYRLDLDEWKWVKKEKLDDCCLFIDAVGRMGLSCRDPERWGGRSSCIYLAGPGCASYSVCPLSDEIDIFDDGAPMSLSNVRLPKWPSPLWVCPNVTRVEKVEGRKARLKRKKVKRSAN